jgi:O-antigen/teichoic acid export membrane protein
MSLRINIISNYVGNVFAVVINFILVPIYLKYLSIEEYGIITFFATITSVFVILDMGLGLTVNKEVAKSLAMKQDSKKTANVIRTFELLYWLVAVFIGSILFFFSDLISGKWLNVENISREKLSLVVSLMGLALVFRWPISFYNNALSGFQKMINLNVIKIIICIINILGVFVLLSYFNAKIEDLFKFLTLLYLINIFLLVFSVWKTTNLSFIKAKFKKEILIDTRKYIVGIGLFSILGTLFTLLDKLVISKFFLASELGYYSLVSAMSLALLQLVYPISSALFPKFVENYTNKKFEDCYLIFKNGYQLVIFLVFSFSSCLIICKEQILLIWTQDEAVTSLSLPYFNPVLIGTVLYSLNVLILSLYTALGKTKMLNYLYATVFIIYSTLLLFSAYNNNMLWIAYSWIIANFIILVVSFVLISKLLGVEKIKTFLVKDVLLSFMFFCSLVVLSYFVKLETNSFLVNSITIVGVLIVSLLIYMSFSSYVRGVFKNIIKKYV